MVRYFDNATAADARQAACDATWWTLPSSLALAQEQLEFHALGQEKSPGVVPGDGVLNA